MEEKRKLEKVLLDDIDSAISSYKSRRGDAREKVEETALAKAPAIAKALLLKFNKARTEAAELDKRIEQMGFRTVSEYGTKNFHLALSYSNKPTLLKDYDAETARVEKSLAGLKRSYTLKLFAGGEEAKELFASLARELAGIIG